MELPGIITISVMGAMLVFIIWAIAPSLLFGGTHRSGDKSHTRHGGRRRRRSRRRTPA